MVNIKHKYFLIFLFAFFIFSVSAVIVPSYKDKYVNDFAGVLNSTEQVQLKEIFSAIDRETSAEIVFVGMDTIGESQISEYALQIGKDWKVGKEDRDNGLVILYVKDINKIWVATGYGLEGILPDSRIGRMLDEYYVPSRELGRVNEGIVLFSYAVSDVIYQNKEEVLSGKRRNNEALGILFAFAIIFFMVLIIIISIKRGGHFKKRNNIWWAPLFIPRSGGGGFSGGGFGGGSFGGGGAGR